MKSSWFTPTPFQYHRFGTHLVKIGNVIIGGDYPIRVQSMANSSTHNIEESIKQAIEIIEAGGELVRYTVINTQDAEALRLIKEGLVQKGFDTPIVADVHFNPLLADIAAKYVDKVRINPGNYLDKRATFATVELTDTEYSQELLRLKERFVPFLNICKEHHTAIRIGTNHGSLSDRIMNRYGDTPAGMVEATLEFLRICQSEQFHNVVVSLKSSNTRVMVQAYRLLAMQMQKEGMACALHLGVTEAGSGEDGRIKSAVGMGTLMHDGLGDTIRVSLTEHPAKEIPVAAALVNHFNAFSFSPILPSVTPAYNPFTYQKRKSNDLGIIGGPNLPVVVADLTAETEVTKKTVFDLGFVLNPVSNQFERTDLSPDVLYIGELDIPFRFEKDVLLVSDHKYWNHQSASVPLFSWEEYLFAANKSMFHNWVQIHYNQLDAKSLEAIKADPTLVLVVYSYAANKTQEIRTFINQLLVNQITNPVIVQQAYSEFQFSDFQLKSAADCGLFFIDGLSDGIWLKNTFKKSNKEITDTAFGILQASRTRTSKTEYISCPSCGRTLFDLEASLAQVKEATSHLRGLKIAIMGCIVNGPGEMADADYGYVGSGPGKVSLYKGKELVRRNIQAKDAVKELLQLIEQNIQKG